MKYLFIVFSYCIITSMYSQTFSKIYDFGDNDALENRFNGLFLSNDHFYINSIIFCNPDSNLYNYCNVLSKFNFNGELENQILNDTFGGLFDFNNSVIGFNENIIVSGVKTKYGSSQGRDTEIYIFDKNLKFLKSLKFAGNPLNSVNNEGIWVLDSTLYLIGNYPNPNPAEAEIYKLDKDFNIIWENTYSAGSSLISCNDIQKTHDGNLAFRLRIEHHAGVSPYPLGFKIVKTNQDGVILKSYFHEDDPNEPNTLLISKDGHYYFNSERDPLKYNNLFTGRLNKLNPSLDSIIWSIVLPNNQLTDGRIYSVEDIIEARNGDILICGKMYDNEVPGGNVNSVWNGFIMRLTSDAKILWLKIYKNPQNLLNKNEYGKHRVSVLKSIKEMENGNLVVAGQVYYNQKQRTQINPIKNETIHLWSMITDSMGCVDGYPCEERVRLYNTSEQKLVNTKVSWTERYINPPIQEKFNRYKFSKDSIFYKNDYYRELLTSDDDTGNNFQGINRFFREENNRIFEYYLSADKLLYDFNLKVLDSIKIPGSTNTFAKMIVVEEMDSTILLNGEKRRTFALDCPGFGEVTPIWIEGISSTLGFLSVYDCDFPVNTTLLCFYKNNSLLYMNPEVNDCLPSSIIKMHQQPFILKPNPALDKIEIQGIIQFDRINIFSSSGLKISNNTNENILDISKLAFGIYIIELESNGKSLGKQKFIKMQ